MSAVNKSVKTAKGTGNDELRGSGHGAEIRADVHRVGDKDKYDEPYNILRLYFLMTAAMPLPVTAPIRAQASWIAIMKGSRKRPSTTGRSRIGRRFAVGGDARRIVVRGARHEPRPRELEQLFRFPAELRHMVIIVNESRFLRYPALEICLKVW